MNLKFHMFTYKCRIYFYHYIKTFLNIVLRYTTILSFFTFIYVFYLFVLKNATFNKK